MNIELTNNDINEIMEALWISRGECNKFHRIYDKFKKKFEDNGIVFESSECNGEIKVNENLNATYVIYNHKNKSYLNRFQSPPIVGHEIANGLYAFRYFWSDDFSKAIEFSTYAQAQIFIDPISKVCEVNINDLEIVKNEKYEGSCKKPIKGIILTELLENVNNEEN